MLSKSNTAGRNKIATGNGIPHTRTEVAPYGHFPPGDKRVPGLKPYRGLQWNGR